MEMMDIISMHSPYLANALEKRPGILEKLSPDDITGTIEQTLADLHRVAQSAPTTADLGKTLRQGKQTVSTLLACADLCGWLSTQDVMHYLSELADTAITTAFNHLYPDQSGLCIIALGKWGAGELNYSSDIDLMVVFNPDTLHVSDKDKAQAHANKLAQDIARLLDERTADGYVFRTDLRLRPDPAAMPLAISIYTAETYYGSLGQNWERAAMIKARPVCGDVILGQHFQRIMTSWIWRRNLDFAAIQDIHSIKRQIGVQQSKRQYRKKKTGYAFAGYNVKLDHGGIREIEFFAQTQQLVHGGRDIDLRAPKTLSALKILKQRCFITDKTCRNLTDAYLFLRHVEHRLQMVDDRQTHTLPENAEDYMRFCRFAGFDDIESFETVLKKHADIVKKQYANLFTESPSLSGSGSLVFTGVEDDLRTLETLSNMGYGEPQKVTAAVRGWHHGRYRATRSERARQILTELVPSLLERLANTTSPDDAFLYFDKFLEKLPAGVPIFSLFLNRPHLMDIMADIMGSAPAMAHYVSLHPEIFEAVINRDFDNPLPDKQTLKTELTRFLKTAQDYQDILDFTRRWANEKRFHAALHALQSLSAPEDCMRYMTDIAEVSLQTLVPHVQNDFATQHGKVPRGKYALVGMGSLGSCTMHTQSDLDIVALYDAPKNITASDGKKPLSVSQYYIRLTQRLITALSSPTAEGVLYAVDARLRPAGDSGPLAISLDGFIKYQTTQAWTWEHLSLLRARVVFGDKTITAKTQKALKKILTRKRDDKTLRHDVKTMQKKVHSHHTKKTVWSCKHIKGGLMDTMFAVQYLCLKHGHRYPSLCQTDLLKSIGILKKYKLVTQKQADSLTKARTCALRTTLFLNLAASKPDDFTYRQTTTGVKDQLESFILYGYKRKPAKKLEAYLRSLFANNAKTVTEILQKK